MSIAGSESESARVPWRLPTVQVVLASTLLAPLGVPLLSPALPVIRDAFGVTDAAASLLISTYFLTGIVLSPFIGMIVDRVGRKRVLVPCLFVFALSGGATVFAPDFTTVLILRLVQGTAAAGIFITTVTLIGDTFEGVQRNAVMGANAAALFTAAAVYPLLGGAFVAIAWHTPFVAYLAGLPVGLLAVFILEEPQIDREARSVGYIHGVIVALPTGEALMLYGATLAIELLTFGALLTALPFLLTSTYNVSSVVVGLVLSAMLAVSAIVAFQNGRLAQRLSNHRLVALSFILFGVSFIAAWLAPSTVLLVVAVLFAGIGIGIPTPSIDAAVSDIAPVEFRAGALSLRNSTSFLGRTIGPVLFTSAAAVTGYQTLFLVAGVAALGCGFLIVLLADTPSTVPAPPRESHRM